MGTRTHKKTKISEANEMKVEIPARKGRVQTANCLQFCAVWTVPKTSSFGAFFLGSLGGTQTSLDRHLGMKKGGTTPNCSSLDRVQTDENLVWTDPNWLKRNRCIYALVKKLEIKNYRHGIHKISTA